MARGSRFEERVSNMNRLIENLNRELTEKVTEAIPPHPRPDIVRAVGTLLDFVSEAEKDGRIHRADRENFVSALAWINKLARG